MSKVKIIPKTTMQIGRSATGSPTFNCGDTVATMLQGLTIDQVLALAQKVGLSTDRYATMNSGHKRMVIGGSLRRRVRDQDKLHAQSPQHIKTGAAWLEELVSQL